MKYNYPSDLAKVVTERWTTLVAMDASLRPFLPSEPALTKILEAAFFASLQTEEGRQLRFTLCCTSQSRVTRYNTREPLKMVHFESPRLLTVQEIRRIASATNASKSALAVSIVGGKDDAVIDGILHIGGDLARARSARSYYYRPSPSALLVEVRGPGELHVYQGPYKMAALISGDMPDFSIVSQLDFLHAGDIVKEGEASLWPKITPPQEEPAKEWHGFQWTALFNVILSIVNGIREEGHGGTLLLVSPSATDNLPIRIKYLVNYDVNFLDESFLNFINARHRLGDAIFKKGYLKDETITDEKLMSYQYETRTMEEQLADSCDFISKLSGVDGALVLTSSFRLLGFGAEILMDQAIPTNLYEVHGETYQETEHPKLNSESFGMRHRSATRFIGAVDNSVAFIVSQDGDVSFCWKKDQKVYLNRRVNISNANMPGA